MGFAALPDGGGNSDGGFSSVGYFGNWWSATEYNANYAYYRFMHYSDEVAECGRNDKTSLQSVRCVKD